jgi:hypothetical protein
MAVTDKLFRNVLKREQEKLMGQNGTLIGTFAREVAVDGETHETVSLNITFLIKTQKRFDLEAGGYIKEAGIDIYNQNGELDRFMSFNSNLDFDMELIYNGSRYSFSLNDPRDYLTNQVSGRIVWLEKILIQ